MKGAPVLQVEDAHRVPAAIGAVIEEGLKEGVAPAMVLAAGNSEGLLYEQAFGVKHNVSDKKLPAQATERNTVFDLANVSAAIATSIVFMRLVQEGKLNLHDKIARYIDGFSVHGKSTASIAQVLSHSAGLPNWLPFFEDLVRENAGARMGILASRGARDYVLNAIKRLQFKYTPGTRQVYSDIGYILLGMLIERLTGLGLEKAVYRDVFRPLGMKSSSYIDLSLMKRRGIHPVPELIAPTEHCPWRKRVLCGEVHDDNAWAMGGIAGHAGVFSSAQDVFRIGQELLLASQGKSTFLDAAVLQDFWSKPPVPREQGWSYGWSYPHEENGMHASGLSEDARGVNGFTGCSLWIEPAQDLVVVLLSNRIHPHRSNRRMASFRPRLHQKILEDWQSRTQH